ncbi:uncharacterized protein LOC120627751 [Pararge aegeria]|uniref:Jg20924 protein n=2 Tax=Pararge aegeria TaxID=116150 RepID=A0A8S4RL26_9NEOP|nr:uncharacterized protein LOC120627751 [Pararge aegeria]CAH2236706.1 jg20924 [Pararge aegeria aegeria]
MALRKSSEIPKDAVVLNEIEATGYIWEIVNQWESPSDIWALRYGAVALGAVSSLTGLLINKHYRWRLKLGTYGYLASAVPIVVMPGILTLLFHKQAITTNMLLMKHETCPICHEVKSAALQLAFGIAYPMVLAPTSALMFANRYSTYRVPHLGAGPKEMFKFLRGHTKSFTGTLAYIAILQLAASAVVTYFEMRHNIKLRNKLAEMERKLDDELL